ncbi:MAG: hypothetical protein LUH08_02915 [Ruminococcus sp.]|nr:hypothetical protein [Ruminococcus sp.]MCD7772990.1 hypothetical protein [Ruminococcus sp.]
MARKEKKTSPFKVFGILCLIILIFASLWVIAVRLVFKNQNVTPSISDTSLYVVRTTDMEPDIEQNTLLFITNKVPTQDDLGSVIVVDDVKTYGTVAVRLRNIITENDAVMYEVGFDSSESTTVVNSSQIVGVAETMDHFVGWAIVQSGTTQGMLLLILTPLLLVIIFFALNSWWKQRRNAKQYLGHKEKVRELEKQVEAIEAEKTEVVERLTKEKEKLLKEVEKEETKENPEPLTPVEEIVEIKEELKQSASNTAIEELLRLCEEENEKLKAQFMVSDDDVDTPAPEVTAPEEPVEPVTDDDVAEAVKHIAETDPEE